MNESVGLIVRPYEAEERLIEDALAGGNVRLDVRRAPAPAVVLGRASRPEIELNIEACRSSGVPVLRRRGGGCAVLIDPGDIIVSLALPVRGLGKISEYNGKLSAWLLEGLEAGGARGLGKRGISDLAAGDRKVSGSSIYRTKDFLFFSASLLIDPDITLMERCLRHPPREPGYRRGRPHRDFVGALADLFPGFSERRLAEALEAGIAELDQGRGWASPGPGRPDFPNDLPQAVSRQARR